MPYAEVSWALREGMLTTAQSLCVVTQFTRTAQQQHWRLKHKGRQTNAEDLHHFGHGRHSVKVLDYVRSKPVIHLYTTHEKLRTAT